jgi:fucose permease
MIKRFFYYISIIFTPYFVGLLLICGLFLSIIYPRVIAHSKYPLEYTIGKWVGYVFIVGGIGAYILVMLFG